jgi:hypothetical protein
MGRHSSDRQFRFYRSVAGWFLPWALVAAVAVTAMWIAVDAIGQEDLDARPPAGASGGRDASPSASPSPSPSSSPSPSPSARSTPRPGGGGGDNAEPPEGEGENGGQPREKPRPLITEGVSVQVLNGTSSPTAADAMAARLQDLGFRIEVVAGATPYDQTTVFWSSEGAGPAARRLASRFGWIAGPKPANLSADVDLHVVVGADEA